VPQLFGEVMRLEVSSSYTRETTQRYYGIGNASVAPDASGAAPPEQFEYGACTRRCSCARRLKIGWGLYLEVGNSSPTIIWNIPAGTKLARDLADPSSPSFWADPVRTPSTSSKTHHCRTRDDEITLGAACTTKSSFARARRGRHFLLIAMRKRTSFSASISILPRALHLRPARRRDAQFGDPPFYELARYEDTFALGGSNGVRGVPAQRYYGR